MASRASGSGISSAWPDAFFRRGLRSSLASLAARRTKPTLQRRSLWIPPPAVIDPNGRLDLGGAADHTKLERRRPWCCQGAAFGKLPEPAMSSFVERALPWRGGCGKRCEVRSLRPRGFQGHRAQRTNWTLPATRAVSRRFSCASEAASLGRTLRRSGRLRERTGHPDPALRSLGPPPSTLFLAKVSKFAWRSPSHSHESIAPLKSKSIESRRWAGKSDGTRRLSMLRADKNAEVVVLPWSFTGMFTGRFGADVRASGSLTPAGRTRGTRVSCRYPMG